MEALALLRAARQAGLIVTVDGDQLTISGPRSAEPLVRQIGEQKRDVILAIDALRGWCLQRESGGGIDAGGRRWCVACRDAELGLQSEPPALTAGRDLRAAWAGAVRELGELLGHPELIYKPGHAIALGPIGWQKFVGRANVEELDLVLGRLKLLVAELPPPAHSIDAGEGDQNEKGVT